MSEELKPCPFCGKDGEHDESLAWCSDPECFAADINMPINEWNTRPIEDVLRKQLEETKAERDELEKRLDYEIPFIDKFHKERDIANYKLEVVMEALRDAWSLSGEIETRLIIENAQNKIAKIGAEK
jgi:hypothetical protein